VSVKIGIIAELSLTRIEPVQLTFVVGRWAHGLRVHPSLADPRESKKVFGRSLWALPHWQATNTIPESADRWLLFRFCRSERNVLSVTLGYVNCTVRPETLFEAGVTCKKELASAFCARKKVSLSAPATQSGPLLWCVHGGPNLKKGASYRPDNCISAKVREA
jgi:hypothetical protein